MLKTCPSVGLSVRLSVRLNPYIEKTIKARAKALRTGYRYSFLTCFIQDVLKWLFKIYKTQIQLYYNHCAWLYPSEAKCKCVFLNAKAGGVCRNQLAVYCTEELRLEKHYRLRSFSSDPANH